MRVYGQRLLERGYVPFYGASCELEPGQSDVLIKPSGAMEEAELITLHLSATISGVDVLPSVVAAQLGATLQWGTGGTVHQAFCDIGRGVAVTLAASALDVGVFYRGSGPRFTLHGTVAYGSRPSTTLSPGLTFTDGPFDFSDATPVVSRVPPFARSATLLINGPSTVGILERFTSDLAGNQSTVRALNLGSAEYGTPWQLPGFGQFYRATALASISVKAWVLYELAL